MQLRSLNIELMSATEKIDATPEGQLMHGVLASFNEFRSRADGADIRLKLWHKAMNGGTIGKAPLGYLNYKEELTDRSVSSVKVDAERAPLIQKAFELHASGEYSAARLQTLMTDLGLRARPTRRWPDSTEVSVNQWHKLLRDPYYTGVVEYQGETYPGRHEALILAQLFQRVQDVMDARHQKGGREVIHFHYLKNLLWCDRCHAAGHDSRLIYTQVQRPAGVYEYFVCVGRKTGTCDLPYLQLDRVEDAVVDHYRHVEVPIAVSEAALETLSLAVRDHQQTALIIRHAADEHLADPRRTGRATDRSGRERRTAAGEDHGTAAQDQVRAQSNHRQPR